MINKVSGVSVNNNQLSFKKFVEGIDLAKESVEAAKTHCIKERKFTFKEKFNMNPTVIKLVQKRDAAILSIKKIFGYKTPDEVKFERHKKFLDNLVESGIITKEDAAEHLRNRELCVSCSSGKMLI